MHDLLEYAVECFVSFCATMRHTLLYVGNLGSVNDDPINPNVNRAV